MKTFEEYMNQRGYGWNDFDRAYEMESLIEQYAEERVKHNIKWIRPSEGLPEDYDVVLVHLSNGRVRSEEFVSGEFIDASTAGLEVITWAEMVKPKI